MTEHDAAGRLAYLLGGAVQALWSANKSVNEAVNSLRFAQEHEGSGLVGGALKAAEAAADAMRAADDTTLALARVVVLQKEAP